MVRCFFCCATAICISVRELEKILKEIVKWAVIYHLTMVKTAVTFRPIGNEPFKRNTNRNWTSVCVRITDEKNTKKDKPFLFLFFAGAVYVYMYPCFS